jgi:hypothetical protein
MSDDKVAVDEARREAQHSAVKGEIEGDVNAEIKQKAAIATPTQSEQVGQVADELRGNAIKEAGDSEHALSRSRTAARGSQFLDYAFYVLYALLAVRLVLALIDARTGSGFVQFINGITAPFVAPFAGIVPSPAAEGGFTLAGPVAIAIAAYMLLHAGINGVLRLVANRKTSI